MTKEKAFRYFFLALVGGSALLLSLSFLPVGQAQGQDVQPPVPMYTLRIEEGRIGVFEGDSDTARYYLDTPAANLPDYDQTLLYNGIPVFSEEELNRRIQDFDG